MTDNIDLKALKELLDKVDNYFNREGQADNVQRYQEYENDRLLKQCQLQLRAALDLMPAAPEEQPSLSNYDHGDISLIPDRVDVEERICEALESPVPLNMNASECYKARIMKMLQSLPAKAAPDSARSLMKYDNAPEYVNLRDIELRNASIRKDGDKWIVEGNQAKAAPGPDSVVVPKKKLLHTINLFEKAYKHPGKLEQERIQWEREKAIDSLKAMLTASQPEQSAQESEHILKIEPVKGDTTRVTITKNDGSVSYFYFNGKLWEKEVGK